MAKIYYDPDVDEAIPIKDYSKRKKLCDCDSLDEKLSFLIGFLIGFNGGK